MPEVVFFKATDDLAEGLPSARKHFPGTSEATVPRAPADRDVLFDSFQALAETKSALISVIIPLWNEEAGIDLLVHRLLRLPKDDLTHWEFVFVDDGSTDATAKRLAAQVGQLLRWKVIQLARNFGQQAAYRAGLDHATGDAIVFLDGDLQ